jgi:hypothetical protein
VRFGEPDAIGEEFYNDFAAADVGMEMWDCGAGMIPRDRSESDLAYPFATHLREA